MNSLSMSPTSEFSNSSDIEPSLSSFFDGGKPTKSHRIANSSGRSSKFPPHVNRWVSWSFIVVFVIYMISAEVLDEGPLRALYRKIRGRTSPNVSNREDNKIEKACFSDEGKELVVTFDNDLKLDKDVSGETLTKIMFLSGQMCPEGDKFPPLKKHFSAKVDGKKMTITKKAKDTDAKEALNEIKCISAIPGEEWKQNLEWNVIKKIEKC